MNKKYWKHILKKYLTNFILTGIIIFIIISLSYFLSSVIQKHKLECYENGGEWIELTFSFDNCTVNTDD